MHSTTNKPIFYFINFSMFKFSLYEPLFSFCIFTYLNYVRYVHGKAPLDDITSVQ